MNFNKNVVYRITMPLSTIPGWMGQAIIEAYKFGQVRGYAAQALTKICLNRFFLVLDGQGEDAVELSTGRIVEIRTLGKSGVHFTRSKNTGVLRKGMTDVEFKIHAMSHEFLLVRARFTPENDLIWELVLLDGKNIAKMGKRLSHGKANKLIDSFPLMDLGQQVQAEDYAN